MVDDSRSAWGYGIATVSKTTGVVLDTWFPNPEVGAPPHNFDSHLLPAHISALEGEDAIRDVNLQGVALAIDLDTPPQSTTDAYLRLHLLSHTLAQPNTLNLEGIFPLLPIVAFTTRGPVEPSYFTTTVSPCKARVQHSPVLTSLGPC